MQAGGVATHDVYRIAGRVIINGEDVGAHVESISVDRDIPSGLPGSGGFRSASGRITATLGEDVQTRPSNPWYRRGNWPPKPMDQVEIILSDGERHWTQFKGTIKDPAGNATSRTVSFTVQDNYQPLNNLVTIPALSSIMPALTDGNYYRYTNLHSVAITDMVLRQVGRFATPRRSSGDVVSATMIGTTWPERGTLLTSIAQDEGAFPDWENTPYGLAVRQVAAEYEPQLWSGTPGGGRITVQPVELTQEVVDTAASTYIRARFANGGRVALIQTPTQVQAAYYTPGGTAYVLASGTKANQVRVTARFWLEGTALNVELRTLNRDGTIISHGTGARGVAQALNGVIDHVWVTGSGTHGAFQVAFPETGREWNILDFQPNTVFHVARFSRNHLVGFPTQVNVPAIELINAQADAEFAQWWIDEHDVLQWWDRGLLAQQPSVGTLTGKDHIMDMPWSYDFDAARSSVTVKYAETSTTQRWRTNLTLWQGGNNTLGQGDEDETFVKVPNDEIWLGVHYQNPYRYGSDTSSFWPRRGIGTVVGGIAVDEDGNERRTNSIIVNLRRITDETYVFTTQVTALGADEQAALQFPSERETDTSLWARWRDEKLPILRGKKKIELIDEISTSSIQGPAQAPAYEHDAGYWIQTAAYAGQTADYAAASLTDPSPTIDQAEIMPVFNLQVGDVVTLSDPDVTGLEVLGLVIGNSISADLSSGSAQQLISLRPNSIRSTGGQWIDFGQARQGNTWADFGNDRAGDTWADFGSRPLD